MSYSRLILSACSKDRLPPGLSTSLPPRLDANAMIQYYLDNVYTLLPFFEETSLYYSVDAVYRAQQDPSSPPNEWDIWQVRMILAITNAFLSQQRGDQYYLEGAGHVSAALEHAERVLKPGAIATVQALLFLAEYSLLDPHHFDSWSIIGAASRAMIDLGLHQDPPRGSRIPKAKLELRRRVSHCVYILDRSSAIVQTRAFTFSDESSNLVCPFTPSQTPPTSSTAQRWLKSFDHSIDFMALRKIQSKWYYDMFQTGRDVWAEPYSYIWQTYRSMTDWFANVSKNTTDAIRIYYEMELLYSYIYILGSSPHVPRPHPYAQTLLFEHCISYANLLSRALGDPNHIAPVTFDDNMRAYMTGMQLLDVLVKSRDQLISGVAPEPPHLASGAPPAPTLPPLQNDSHSNVVRAINAIKSITDILKIFGQRWGYSNWRDDFAAAVDPMLKALNSRLWELLQTSVDAGVGRRPSHAMMNHSSGNVTTLDTLSRQTSNNQMTSPPPVSPPQHHPHGPHPAYTQGLTGPQLRAMRSSSGSIPAAFYNGYTPSNDAVSPPYELSFPGLAASSVGNSSIAGSNAGSPHLAMSHQHPSYQSSPPPAPLGTTSIPPPSVHQQYLNSGGAPGSVAAVPPASGPDDPKGQFAAWTGMMGPPPTQAVQRGTMLPRTNS